MNMYEKNLNTKEWVCQNYSSKYKRMAAEVRDNNIWMFLHLGYKIVICFCFLYGN